MASRDPKRSKDENEKDQTARQKFLSKSLVNTVSGRFTASFPLIGGGLRSREPSPKLSVTAPNMNYELSIRPVDDDSFKQKQISTSRTKWVNGTMNDSQSNDELTKQGLPRFSKPASIPHMKLLSGTENLRIEIGLENLGNTCFANSSLQCLLHIVPLVRFFLESDMILCLNTSSPTKGEIAASFSELIHEVYNASEGTYVTPLTFLRTVSVHAPHLLDSNQQDCQEFLRFILDSMCEDLCRRSPNKAVTATAIATGNLAMSPSSLRKLQLQQQQQIKQFQFQNSNQIFTFETPSSLPSLTASLKQSTSPMISKTIEKHRTFQVDNTRSIGTGSKISSSASSTLVGDDETSETDTKILCVDNQRFVPTMPSPSRRNLRQRGRSIRKNGYRLPLVDPSMRVDDGNSSLYGGNETTLNQRIGVIGLIGGKEDLKPILNLSPVKQQQIDSSNTPTKRGKVVSSNRVSDLTDSKSESLLDHSSSHRLQEQNRYHETGSRNDALKPPILEQLTEHNDRREAYHTIENLHVEADKAWNAYLKFNDSVISDLFAGQLQSTIECQTCHHRSSCFDPFLDLSVPIPKPIDQKGFLGRRISSEPSHCTLEECLEKFVGDELLDGDNMVTCDHCREKRVSVKRMSIYRYPHILVIHIKRFRFHHHRREKLNTDVNFPMQGLEITNYLSSDRPTLFTNEPVYDLIGVSNHSGNMNGGHYIAHVNTNNFNFNDEARWICFNDARVSSAQPSNISGPSAYVLFYRLREDQENLFDGMKFHRRLLLDSIEQRHGVHSHDRFRRQLESDNDKSSADSCSPSKRRPIETY